MQPKMTIAEAATFLNLSAQAIHKRIKTKELPVKRISNTFYFGHDTARPLFNIQFPKKIFAFHNIKGGVGKTELTFCLAIKANLFGARVLCIDLDLQANLTRGCFKTNSADKPIMIDVLRDKLPIEKTIINILPGLDLMPSDLDNSMLDNTLTLGRFPLDRAYKEHIRPLIANYDVIFIDCPPALTASVVAASLSADEVIAPITPDEHSLAGLNLLYDEYRDLESKYNVSIPLKVVFNKFDVRNNLSHDKLNYLKETPKYSPLLYQSYIRHAQDFPNSTNNGQTIYDSLRRGAAKEDIDLFTRELLGIDKQHQG